ncbi:hypothetical protein R3P38DRAFT_3200913 [Favolaschia claudopus]|uniref:Uncharacterized protein n=1 Tax=Favolaschia claudopus TaxID=2862362 RepID=A0AAW0AZ22_9AGAR
MERGMDVVETRCASRSFFPNFFLVTLFLVPPHILCPPKAAFPRTMMSVVVHSENPAEATPPEPRRFTPGSREDSCGVPVSPCLDNGRSHLACDSCRREHRRRREFQPASTTVERGGFQLVSTSVERVTSRATRVAASIIVIVVNSSRLRPPPVEPGEFQVAATSVDSALVNSSPSRAPSVEPGTFQVSATSVERIFACGSVAFTSRSPLAASTLYARCIPAGAALVTDDALTSSSSFVCTQHIVVGVVWVVLVTNAEHTQAYPVFIALLCYPYETPSSTNVLIPRPWFKPMRDALHIQRSETSIPHLQTQHATASAPARLREGPTANLKTRFLQCSCDPTYIAYLLEQFKPVSQLIKRFYWQSEIMPAFDRVLVGISSIALWLQTNFSDVWPEPYEVLPQGFDMSKVASLSVMDQSFTIPDSLELYPNFPREVLKPNATEHKALYDLAMTFTSLHQLFCHDTVGEVEDRPFADAVLTSVVLLASQIPEEESWDRVLPIPTRQHLLIPASSSLGLVAVSDPVLDVWPPPVLVFKVAPSTPAIAETGHSGLSGPGIPSSGLSFGTPSPALSPPKPAVSTASVSHPADAFAAPILEGKTIIPPSGDAESGPSGEGNASAEDPFVDPTPASSSTAALVMAALTLSTQAASRANSPKPVSPIPVDPPQLEPESSAPEPAASELFAGGGGGGGALRLLEVVRHPAHMVAVAKAPPSVLAEPDTSLEAVATGIEPEEPSAETKSARLSKRCREELEEADPEESSSDDDGKGRAKPESSDDGYISHVPQLVKKTRRVSRKNKEDPYVPNFDPVIFDQEFTTIAMNKLETDFRTLFKSGINVLVHRIGWMRELHPSQSQVSPFVISVPEGRKKEEGERREEVGSGSRQKGGTDKMPKWNPGEVEPRTTDIKTTTPQVE